MSIFERLSPGPTQKILITFHQATTWVPDLDSNRADPSFSAAPSVMRQITDKRKVVPACFILYSVNLDPHKVEAHSPGKGFTLANFNRRVVA
jgi:hypothetical protein